MYKYISVLATLFLTYGHKLLFKCEEDHIMSKFLNDLISRE